MVAFEAKKIFLPIGEKKSCLVFSIKDYSEEVKVGIIYIVPIY
jgi:hypothetical protein